MKAQETRRPVTGLILAGGKSRRFGSDKAWAEFHGRTLLQWVADGVAAACSEVLIVHAAGQLLPPIQVPVPVRCVQDEFEEMGPLAGLITGFPHIQHEYCVSASVDVPLLQPGVVRRIAERAVGHDVAVPYVGGFRQPLIAGYRPATCLAPFRRSLLGGDRRILAAYAGLNVTEVTEDDLLDMDRDLRSFKNANRPDALQELSGILCGTPVEGENSSLDRV
ncbi:MAG: molybdenum cofactor guanylyltransferase [Dehalococcoidia bacterium]|nr:molybdenum cofactor guanylyltransferase [Dehalococcoidia bacterium]